MKSDSGEPSGEPQEEATEMQDHEDLHAMLDLHSIFVIIANSTYYFDIYNCCSCDVFLHFCKQYSKNCIFLNPQLLRTVRLVGRKVHFYMTLIVISIALFLHCCQNKTSICYQPSHVQKGRSFNILFCAIVANMCTNIFQKGLGYTLDLSLIFEQLSCAGRIRVSF